MSNVIKLTNRMLQLLKHEQEPTTHKRHRSNASIIKDTVVARTKGSQPEAATKNQGKRLCGICRKPGHKRTTCKDKKVALSKQKEEVSTCSESARAYSSDSEDLFEVGLYKAPSDDDDIFC